MAGVLVPHGHYGGAVPDWMMVGGILIFVLVWISNIRDAWIEANATARFRAVIARVQVLATMAWRRLF
ncbi:hypothetical protein ABZR86_02310 [Dyella marensis]|uniref:Uncharacterized protein n=1 Tax=Dyella marensis TaxID=500610 RepID=A0A1I2A3A0_9GAMM|nr:MULTISPECIES: hypothetical protein [Dyella]SFE38422.1 hypothetical protein SAMN02799615_00909 [Dyella marensis]